MKNKHFLILAAILVVFAMLGCKGPDNPVQATSITVTFNANWEGGGQEKFTIPKDTALGAANMARVQALQVREGFAFKGWALTEDGTAVTVNENSAWTEDATYYGLWEEIPEGSGIVISYNMNGFPGTAPLDFTAISGEPIGAAALPVLSAADYIWRGWATTATGNPITASASFTADTTLYARYTVSSSEPPWPPIPMAFDIPYDMHPLRANVPANFIRGADVSNNHQIYQYGGKYYNFDGQEQEIMQLLADNGVNYVRLRLWHTPSESPYNYAGDGDCNLARVTEMAVRAKAAGLKVLIAFHYSDYWADPGKQHVPKAWSGAGYTTAQSLYDAVESYTAEVILHLIAAGATPDMVAIGNEIGSGLLTSRAGASAGTTGATLSGWDQYCRALQAASRAVRASAPNAKIMIHMDQAGNSGRLSNYAQFTRRVDNNAAATVLEVDYDVIGLSWYHFWSSHGTIDDMTANIAAFKTRFGKEVIICESGTSFTVQDIDYQNAVNNQVRTYVSPPTTQVWIPFDLSTATSGEAGERNLRNVYGVKNDTDSLGYSRLPASNAFVRDSGVAHTSNTLPSTVENQARAYRAVMEAVVAGGGDGVMWWGADWIPCAGTVSNVENAALFGNGEAAAPLGHALPALRVLGGIKGANEKAPGKVLRFSAAAQAGTSAALTWSAVHANIASRYEVERAEGTAGGAWTSLDANITGTSYTAAGLAENTTYRFRIRAYNSNGWGVWSDPVEVTTTAFQFGTPAGLRVTASDSSSVTLAWNAVAGAASYRLYGAQSTNAPADDSGYTQLGGAITGTAYTHTGLTAGQIWWYKVSAYYDPQGEGPRSAAISAEVGAMVDLKASISMATGTLDEDFLDPLKAASSTDGRPATDSAAVYTIHGLYVANDATNLYVALDMGPSPVWAYEHDRIVVWVDNTSSDAASVTLTDMLIASNQTVIGTVDHVVYRKLRDRAPQPSTGPQKGTMNITGWQHNSNDPWLNTPTGPAGVTVVKWSIPLADIRNAVQGDELKVFAAFSMGWSNGSDIRVGSYIPQAALTGSGDTATIDMANALSYVVK